MRRVPLIRLEKGVLRVNCPCCEHQHTRVLESRISGAGDSMRRRRQCLACGERFTTYERREHQTIWVEKHGGVQEPFDREKLLAGLVRACNKRNVVHERLESLVIEIESGLARRSATENAVSSSVIGDLALEGLFMIDHVAYVRFASVYKAFDDLDEFQQELERVASRVGQKACREGSGMKLKETNTNK